MEPAELMRRYGRKPANRHLLFQQRKYFDSGDYALSKAGKGGDAVGSQHPVPEDIPHPTVPPHTPVALASPDGAPAGLTPLPKLTLPLAGLQGGIFPGNLGLTSPVRESSFLQRETSINDVDESDDTPTDAKPAPGPTEGTVNESAPPPPLPRSGSLPFRT